MRVQLACVLGVVLLVGCEEETKPPPRAPASVETNTSKASAPPKKGKWGGLPPPKGAIEEADVQEEEEAKPPPKKKKPVPGEEEFPLPDPSAIPSGTGWWCIHFGELSEPISDCIRDQATCMQLRAAVAKDNPVDAAKGLLGKCEYHVAAACFTYRDRTSGDTRVNCAESLSSCVWAAGRRLKNKIDYDQISACQGFK